MIQLILLIFLTVIEVFAFAWLIVNIKKAAQQQTQILEVENQILKLEKTILSMDKRIVKKIDKINQFTQWEKELLKNDKKIKGLDIPLTYLNHTK